MKTRILKGILGILIVMGLVLCEINMLGVEAQGTIKGYHIVIIYGTIHPTKKGCPGVASNCNITIYTPVY